MRLTIARKLGMGFGAVILLMVMGAVVAYIKTGDMIASQSEAIDNAMPTAQACQTLNSGVQESIAALRGYIILGADPKSADKFKSQHDEAWSRIDAALARLQGFSRNWSTDDASSLAELVREIDEFRNDENNVLSLSHTVDNEPAQRMLEQDIVPMFDDSFQAISAVMDLEATIAPTSERRALFVALASLRGFVAANMSDVRAFILSGDKKYSQRTQDGWKMQDTAKEKCVAHIDLLTPEERTNWDHFVTIRGEFHQAELQAMQLRQAPDWNRAIYLLSTSAVPRISSISDRLKTLLQSADARVDGASATVMTAADALRTTLLIATCLAIIVGTFVAIMLSRKIVLAIGKLVARARQIASGDLTGAPLEVRGSDEVAMLATTFNEMQAGLKDVTSQIRQVTENVNSASAEILAAAQQQAASTKEQAATLQEITSTMQEICESGEQVSQRAKDIVTNVESTMSSNASGVEAVQASTRNMDTIREQVEEVAENIVALSERTQTIGEIISAVTDIAEQSNLLALNAAIEAVSAGEQGSRFSVVATEMKNLADQAKESTVQVRNILGEIQKGINSSVMMTEEAVKRVETGKQQAGVTERTIRDMSGTTQTSVQTFEQIIGASAQQQIGFDQVTKGVKDIHIAVEQTAAGVTQLERATSSLNALSQQLRTAVERYRV